MRLAGRPVRARATASRARARMLGPLARPRPVRSCVSSARVRSTAGADAGDVGADTASASDGDRTGRSRPGSPCAPDGERSHSVRWSSANPGDRGPVVGDRDGPHAAHPVLVDLAARSRSGRSRCRASASRARAGCRRPVKTRSPLFAAATGAAPRTRPSARRVDGRPAGNRRAAGNRPERRRAAGWTDGLIDRLLRVALATRAAPYLVRGRATPPWVSLVAPRRARHGRTARHSAHDDDARRPRRPAPPRRPPRPRPARHGDLLPRLAAGGGPPDAHEQPRPRGRREPRRPRRLRRDRPGRPQLGGLRRDRPRAPRPRRRRDAPRPVGQAGRRLPDEPVGAAGARSPTRTSSGSGPPGSTSGSSSGPA